MKIIRPDGSLFLPTKQDLFKFLLLLKGLFEPQCYFLYFKTKRLKLSALEDYLQPAGTYMLLLASSPGYPDLNQMAARTSVLTYQECAQFLLYTLRAVYKQGGGWDFFNEAWMNGTIYRVVTRVMDLFDEIPEFNPEDFQ